MAGQFDLQPNFPVAGVADLIAARPYKEAQMRQQQQAQLIQGLQGFSQGVQSLVARRQAMAQALAGAQLYAQTPEGQQALGNNQVATGPAGQPVAMNQTAQGSVGQAPVPNQSPVNMGTLQTAFMGESPSNLLSQLYERQKQRQQFGLEQQKQAFHEKIEPIKLAQQAQLTQALTGIKGQQVTNENDANIRSQITALEGKKAQYIKDFPEMTGTFLNRVLPPGSNAKEEAAFKDYQETQKQIDDYNRQLYKGNSASKNSPLAHMSTADLLAIVNQASQ